VQSIYTWGLIDPWDVVFDSAGNLFVVDYDRDELFGEAAVYKITQDGRGTIFATGLSHLSHLTCDKTGNLFVADYDDGVIYNYKPDGSRATFATGLYHPAGMAFDSTGILFVADNSAGNLHEGSIYRYQPNGSRSTFAALAPSDHPTDLAFDAMGNLFMADQGGNIYKYDLGGVLRRQRRTTFGSVPGSAQSLAFDSTGNLLVVDAGDVNGIGSTEPNAIYKFTQQGARTAFASAEALGERFSQLGFGPTTPSNQ
jgi:sugar lactone lactonase YvrE